MSATATAVANPNEMPDHVHVEVPRQHRMLMPGKYYMPIGQAYELVHWGIAKIQPQSAKQFEEFKKSTERAAAKHAAQQEEQAKAREQESKDRVKRQGVKPNEWLKGRLGGGQGKKASRG